MGGGGVNWGGMGDRWTRERIGRGCQVTRGVVGDVPTSFQAQNVDVEPSMDLEGGQVRA